jgi:hypothetical protein
MKFITNMTAVVRLKPLLSEDAYAFVTNNQLLKELVAHVFGGMWRRPLVASTMSLSPRH